MAVDEPSDEEVTKNIQAYVDGLLSICANLVRSKGAKPLTEPEGLASGFFVQRNGRLFLLSAGHAVCKHRWYWEMPVDLSDQRRSLCLPVGPFSLLKRFTVQNGGTAKIQRRSIDFGWCEVDVIKLTQQFQSDPALAGKKLEIKPYIGPLDEQPVADEEIYSFAAWNRGRLVPAGVLFLERAMSYEIGMRFVRKNAYGKYVFKLARTHQGHSYYRGASGAPIADPSGKIVSLVLGGSEKRHEIYGLPLADFSHLLELA